MHMRSEKRISQSIMEPLEINFRLDTSPDITQSIKELLQKVWPTWKTEEIVVEVLIGGVVNKNWVCHHEKDNIKYVVKMVDSEGAVSFPLKDMEYDLKAMTAASKCGIIDPIICRFQNGFIYKYVEGKIPSFTQLHTTHIRRLLFAKVHKMHTLELPPRVQHPNILESCLMYRIMTYLLPDLPEKLCDISPTICLSRQVLEQEVEFAKKVMQELYEKYPIIFCHLDLQNNNVVYDPETDEITMIDWEMCGHSIIPFECARNTVNWFGEQGDIQPLLKEWIQDYLETDPEKPETSDNLLASMLSDFMKATMVNYMSNLVGVLWMVAFTEDHKDIFLPMVEKFWGMYNQQKTQLYG